jgi:hypothetical protein
MTTIPFALRKVAAKVEMSVNQMKLTLVIYFLAASCTFAGNLWFSEMENGDSVEVTEHSTGCFHNWTHYFEVRRSDDSFSFTQYEITWDKSNPPQIVEKKALGTTTLSKKDIKGLDALLKFYRGKKEGGSTTFTSLVVEYFEPGRRVMIEKLEDGSGGFYRDKDALDFFRLTQRFKANGGK